jgi:O-antigen/teichoic acid export membrane protein
MLKIINSYKNNIRLQQVLGLFSANLIGIPLGLVTNIIISGYLGSKGYGDYRLVASIFNFASVIFTFGLIQAGSRALVLNQNKNNAKEYYGTELIITAGLFFVMSIFLYGYVAIDKNLHEKELKMFMIYAIPFSWVFLMQKYCETLFQADNKIELLAKTRLYPQIGLLVAALFIHFYLKKFAIDRLSVIWVMYIAIQTATIIWVIIKINASYVNISVRLKEIFSYNKTFGFDIYLGSIFAVGFSQLSPIIVSYFSEDNSGVGFYSLALTLAMPLAFIPNTIATTHYKDFAIQKSISKKLIILTLTLSIAALICLWLVVGLFVSYFYGEEFKEVTPLFYIISIGIIAHGMADFFNRYMGANGQGRTLRNTSFLVGASILLGNLLLIPYWGEYGAAYTNLGSGFIYLITMLIAYIRYISKNI